MLQLKIKSVKKIQNNSKRYDIETQYTHAFFANNIYVHNSSFSCYKRDEHFGVCSRNFELDREDSNGTFWNMAKKYDLENKLNSLGKNYALQGELIGPGVQKNKYQLKEHEVLFFNVYDIDKGCYLDYEEFEKVIKDLGLKSCPTIDDNFVLNHTVQELVDMSIGMSKLNNQTHREGLVFRSKKEKQIHRLGRCSFKAINPKFLLKYEE